MNSDDVARVACTFVAHYYKGFVEDMRALSSMYSPKAVMTFATNEPNTFPGIDAIQHQLSYLDALWGPRKVCVQTVDWCLNSNATISVMAAGKIFTPSYVRQFSQGFLLVQSLRVENEYHVESDMLRILEETPTQTAPMHQGAAEVTRPAVFEENDEEEPAAIENRKDHKNKEKNLIVVFSVPNRATMRDVEDGAKQYGNVVGVKWYGRFNATVEFATDADAKKLVDSNDLMINGRYVKVDWFKPGRQKH